MRGILIWAWRGLPALFGAAGLTMLQASPEQVGSNAAAWARFFGIEHVPAWLAVPSADQWGTGIASCAIGVSVYLVLREIGSRRRTAEPPNPDAVMPRLVARDVLVWDAIYYAALGRWPETDTLDLAALNPFGEALREIRQQARDGALPIWGRNSASGTLNRIPPDYWEDYSLDFLNFIRGRESLTAKSSSRKIGIGVQRDLMTSRAKVEEIWSAAAAPARSRA